MPCIGTMQPLTAWSPGCTRSKPFKPPEGGTPNQPRFKERMHDEIGSEAQTRWLPLSLTLLDGEQMVLTADEECRFRHRGSRHQGFAHWILGQQLALGSGRIDEYIAVFAGEVESAIGGHRGGAEAAAAMLDPFAENLTARRKFVAVKQSLVVHHVKPSLVDQRRRRVGALAHLAPGDETVGRLFAFERDVASGARMNREERAFRRSSA